MIISIPVTQSHIWRGKKTECDLCLIALALKDIFPTVRALSVTPHSIVPNYSAENQIHLPEIARKFISDFDTDFAKVAPFSFEIEIAEDIAAQWGYRHAESVVE